jgi:hypothetical protein
MTRPQTLADRHEYLEGGLSGLACEGCGALVRVKKLSPPHTSVQWTPAAAGRCAEFAATRALGEPSALVQTCLTLRASIERAANKGELR